MSSTPKITILGHVCIDKNSIDGENTRTWGSPAMYIASYYFHQYGLKSHIISEYGTDFADYIGPHIVMASGPSHMKTLVYENNLSHGKRTQRCLNSELSRPVEFNALTSKLIAETDMLIIAPCIDNYSDKYINQAVSLVGANCRKILMPQGLFRQVEGNLVVQKNSINPSILNLFDTVIFSEEDLVNSAQKAKLWSQKYTQTSIIVTMSRDGAALYEDGFELIIPTSHFIDDSGSLNTVGAGDMFGAEVAMQMLNGVNTKQSILAAHKSTAKMLSERWLSDSNKLAALSL